MITAKDTKMLEPGQLKTDSLEMKRITTVLDKMIDKLELSGLIPCIIASLDSFAGILGPEMKHSLTEHQKLSNEVEQLLASSGERDTMRAEQQQGCLCSLEQQLKCSVRNILRLLLVKPSLCQALKNQFLVGQSPAEVFIKAFGEFRNFMLEELLTSPVEEEERIGLVEDTSLRIKENTEAITALRAELAAAIQTRDEEIHKRDNVIKELKTSVQDLPKDCKTSIQQIKQEAEKPQKEELQASQARCARLQEDIQQLGAQLHALELEHRSSELALRKRKSRMETEIVNWIQKYHTDMEEKQAEYEEVQAAYVEEQAQLSMLTEKHAVLLQEYSQIEEERRLLQEKKDQALQELKTMTLAATRIQAFWRGYFIRTLLKSKRKKKGKGKDKGKKTKK